MEPGHDDIYQDIARLGRAMARLEHRIAVQDACLRIQDQDIAGLRRHIAALEKLAGATPAEVALATADRVVQTHRLGFSAGFERDEENDPYGKL